MKLCRISQELIQEVLGMYVRQEAAGNPRPRQEDHAQHAPDKSKQNARKQTKNNKQTNQINIPMFLWLCAFSCVHLGRRNLNILAKFAQKTYRTTQYQILQ